MLTEDCESWEAEQAMVMSELRQEVERLCERQRSDEDQLCRIASYLGKDARHVTGEGRHDIASLVIQEMEQSIKDWCADDESIKVQALRVLPSSVVEGDTHYVPRMGALSELMADECDRLRTLLTQVRSLLELQQLTGASRTSECRCCELISKVVGDG